MKNDKWKEIVVHNELMVKGFFGSYRWLSNFELTRVTYEGVDYPSVENAYQASKLWPADRTTFMTMTPGQSKVMWKQFQPRHANAESWDAEKFDIMAQLVTSKFLGNESLKKNLLATGEKYLEETNYWKDSYWGVDVVKGGKNKLGLILMNVRAYLVELEKSKNDDIVFPYIG